MPLVWDVGAVKDWKHVTTAPWTRDAEEQEWHPVTQALIWSAISCGWSKITEENAEEIATRISIEGELFGPHYSFADGTPCIPTLADVRMHIGMTVNAVPKTRPQWFKGVWKRVSERLPVRSVSMYEKHEQREADRRGVSNIGSVPA